MDYRKRFLVEPGIKIRLSRSPGEDGEGGKENVSGYSVQNAPRKRRPNPEASHHGDMSRLSWRQRIDLYWSRG
jgi:hypothetical protein